MQRFLSTFNFLRLTCLFWLLLSLASNSLCDTRSRASTDNFLQSVGIAPSAISAATRELGDQELACAALRIAHHGEVVPESNSTGYTTEREAHWSATSWESPTCIYNPTTAQDVVFAVKVLGYTGTKYAIRGGGHTPLTGWASINDGILISMTTLNDLTYDAVSQTVRAGTGNRWGAIYNYTETFGRLVVGGRVTDIGMGLAIGGGLSHLSNQYGFAADNVVEFELVLADESLVNASATSNPDLFWALKGGTSNFGIVTHITMKTYPLGKVWGGVIAYNNTYTDILMQAFATYQTSGQLDTKSAIITDMVITQDINIFTFIYLAPVSRPPAFAPFYDIPALYDLTKLHDNFTDLVGPPLNTGLPRWTWGTTTMYLDSATYVEVANICQNQTAQLANITDGTMVLLPQPISTTMVDASLLTSGNALGLTSKAQMWFTINLGWVLESDDAKIYPILTETLAQIETVTKPRGLYDPFTFLNDAFSTQPVFQNYGTANYQRLQAVARKYDPRGMFQVQVPGGFKIF